MSELEAPPPKRPDYPYREGNIIVIGPECFVSDDGSVLCWRGTNYVVQEPPTVEVVSEQATVEAEEALSSTQADLHIEDSSGWTPDEQVKSDDSEQFPSDDLVYPLPKMDYELREGIAGETERPWFPRPTELQAKLVMWAMVSGIVAVFATIVVLCILLLIQVAQNS